MGGPVEREGYPLFHRGCRGCSSSCRCDRCENDGSRSRGTDAFQVSAWVGFASLDRADAQGDSGRDFCDRRGGSRQRGPLCCRNACSRRRETRQAPRPVPLGPGRRSKERQGAGLTRASSRSHLSARVDAPQSVPIRDAVAILRRGGLVAFPTETVYGLGADASSPAAVARIYEVKGRPAGHPLIVHIGDIGELDRWARDVPEAAIRLAAPFWPGPLTLVLRRAPGVADQLTGGQDTIGLRIPGHPIALQLLREFGGGIAAPSANRFGRISPTTAEHVRGDLGSEVDLVLDGGTCEIGIESTIVDLSRGASESRSSSATPSVAAISSATHGVALEERDSDAP